MCPLQIIDASAGGWHSAAVSAFNDLYVWGWNVNGQLGLPVYENYEVRQKNGEKSMEKQKLSTVFPSPVIVDLPKNSLNNDFDNHYSPITVDAGALHTIVKTDDGQFLGAGWNKYGQLADTDLDNDIDQFRRIDIEHSNNFNVICGEWSTVLVSDN